MLNGFHILTTTKVTLRKSVFTLVLTANISTLTTARRLLWFGTKNTTGSNTTSTTSLRSSCRYYLLNRTILKSYAHTGSCDAIIFSTVRGSIDSSSSSSRHHTTNAFRSKFISHTTANSCSANTSSTFATAASSAPSSTTDSVGNNVNNSNHSNKVKILFLGCMNDVNSVQQSIMKMQQLYSTQEVFDIAFTSVTTNAALQHLQQVYRRNMNYPSSQNYTSMPFQLPVLYLQDTNVTAAYISNERYHQHALSMINGNSNNSHKPNEKTTHSKGNATDSTSASINPPSGNFYTLAPNLYVLRHCHENDVHDNRNQDEDEDDPQSGIWNIPIPNNGSYNPNNYIVVASVRPYYRTQDKSDTKYPCTSSRVSLSNTIQHASYIGCDILLSTEWPQGMESIYRQHAPIFLSATPDRPQTESSSTTKESPFPKISLWTSYDVADVALRARPRYHIALQQPITPTSAPTAASEPSLPLSLQYFQSPPFSHLTSTVSTRQSILHTGRFIAISPVPSTTITNTTPQMARLHKFLHAISIVPLHTMNKTSTNESNVGVLPNPYTDVVYPVDDRPVTTSRTTALMSRNKASINVGLSEASARRIIAESNQQTTQTDQFRWSVGSNQNNKRPRSMETTSDVDVNNCSLFLYGLQQDRTGRLQTAIRNNIPNEPNIILQALHDFSVRRVRYPRRANPKLPVSSNYAFLDFPSHAHALKCLQHFQTSGVEIMGIQLTLRWATPFVPPRTQPGVLGKNDPSSAYLLPESKKQNTGISKRLREQEAKDSSTLYFKYTNLAKGFETIGGRKRAIDLSTKAEADEEVSTEMQVNWKKLHQHQLQLHDNEMQVLRKVPKIDIAGEMIREWMEEILANALTNGKRTKAKARIRAADEPALQVKLSLPKDASSVIDLNAPFCFFRFASHAAASMAITKLTGSIDGGFILNQQKALRLHKQQIQRKQEKSASPSSPKDGEEPSSSKEIDKSQSTEDTNSLDVALSLFTPSIGLYLNWTNDYVQPALSSEEHDIIISEESGFKFERKHFPRDSQTDCWFCLASSACEKHLITGVYETCYMIMPKGPVHPGHVLIVPIQHTSHGALKDAGVAAEMEDLKMKLRQHALIAYNSDLFVFERAIQTRGGYHAHVQCIPVPRTIGLNLQSTLLAQGRKFGLEIREINTDLGLNAISIANDDDENATDGGGYFYAEVPMLGREPKRFIHKVKFLTPTLSGRDRSGVNMQFGREVLALVLEDPKIAHWKSCVVDAEHEAAMAAHFRESFEMASNDRRTHPKIFTAGNEVV